MGYNWAKLAKYANQHDKDESDKYRKENVDRLEDTYLKYNKAPEPHRSFIDRSFDALSATTYPIMGALKGLIDRDNVYTPDVDENTNPFINFGKGLKASNPLGEGYQEGEYTFSDVLGSAGWNPDSLPGKIAKGGVGLVGDVFLDPLTYVSGGTSALFKGSGKKIGKEVIEELGEESAEAFVKRYGKKATDEGYDKLFSSDVGKEVDNLTNQYKKIRGIDQVEDGINFSLGNAPFAEKIFGKELASKTHKIANNKTLIELGDKTIAPWVNKARDAYMGSKVGELFTNKSGLYKLAKEKPDDFYKAIKISEIAKGVTGDKMKAEKLIRNKVSTLLDLTPAQQKEIVELLENPSIWNPIRKFIHTDDGERFAREVENSKKYISDEITKLQDEIKALEKEIGGIEKANKGVTKHNEDVVSRVTKEREEILEPTLEEIEKLQGERQKLIDKREGIKTDKKITKKNAKNATEELDAYLERIKQLEDVQVEKEIKTPKNANEEVTSSANTQKTTVSKEEIEKARKNAKPLSNNKDVTYLGEKEALKKELDHYIDRYKHNKELITDDVELRDVREMVRNGDRNMPLPKGYTTFKDRIVKGDFNETGEIIADVKDYFNESPVSFARKDKAGRTWRGIKRNPDELKKLNKADKYEQVKYLIKNTPMLKDNYDMALLRNIDELSNKQIREVIDRDALKRKAKEMSEELKALQKTDEYAKKQLITDEGVIYKKLYDDEVKRIKKGVKKTRDNLTHKQLDRIIDTYYNGTMADMISMQHQLHKDYARVRDYANNKYKSYNTLSTQLKDALKRGEKDYAMELKQTIARRQSAIETILDMEDTERLRFLNTMDEKFGNKKVNVPSVKQMEKDMEQITKYGSGIEEEFDEFYRDKWKNADYETFERTPYANDLDASGANKEKELLEKLFGDDVKAIDDGKDTDLISIERKVEGERAGQMEMDLSDVKKETPKYATQEDAYIKNMNKQVEQINELRSETGTQIKFGNDIYKMDINANEFEKQRKVTLENEVKNANQQIASLDKEHKRTSNKISFLNKKIHKLEADGDVISQELTDKLNREMAEHIDVQSRMDAIEAHKARIQRNYDELKKLDANSITDDAIESYARYKLGNKHVDKVLRETPDMMFKRMQIDDMDLDKRVDFEVRRLRDIFIDIASDEVRVGKLSVKRAENMLKKYLPHMLTDDGLEHIKKLEIERGAVKGEFVTNDLGFGSVFNPHAKQRGQGLKEMLGVPGDVETVNEWNDFMKPMLQGKNFFSDNIADIYLSRAMKHNELMYDYNYMHGMMDVFGEDLPESVEGILDGHKPVVNVGLLKSEIDEYAKKEVDRHIREAKKAGINLTSERKDEIFDMSKETFLKFLKIDSKALSDNIKPFIVLDDLETAHHVASKVPKLKPRTMHENIINKSNLARDVQIKKDGGRLINLFDKLTHFWKINVTAVTPGFHIRNKTSNMLQNYLAIGKDAFDADLHKIAHRAVTKKGTFDMKDVLHGIDKDGNKHVYSLAEEYQVAKSLGVIDEGFFAKDLPESSGTEGLLQNFGVNPKYDPTDTRNFVWYNKGKKLGNYMENTDRFVHYLAMRKNGYSPLDATQSVEKFLFDYSDLTQFEQVHIKRLLPFYTWIRKNAPLQAEQLINQPGKYKRMLHVIRNIDKMEDEGYRMDDAYTSDYMHEFIQLPIRVSNQEGRKENLMINPNLPVNDLNNLPIVPRNFVSALNPVLKVPYEQATNKNTFFDSPLVREGESQGVERAKHIIGQLSMPRFAMGLTSKDKDDLPSHIASTGMGLKTATYDYNKYKYYELVELINQAREANKNH